LWVLGLRRSVSTKSTRRPYFANIVESVEAPGDASLVIHLVHADGAFLNKVAGYLMLVPKDYTEALPNPEAFARAPVGSCPYRFVEQKVTRRCRRHSPQALSAPIPRRVMSPEDGSGTGCSRLSPRFEALPAAAASNQPPCVVIPMEALRN
jgi:hypothetical protein